MPGLVKKLSIIAASDGLLLQPVPNREPERSIRIEYGTNRILRGGPRDDILSEGLEAHGIVGLLDLVSSSYLISITRREQVARIRDCPIFRITDVALIPLKSEKDARQAIDDRKRALKERAGKNVAVETDDSDVGDDAEVSTVGSVDTVDVSEIGPEAEAGRDKTKKGGANTGIVQQSTSFVKNVVQEKGGYGRFASQWLTRNGSKDHVTRQEGISAKDHVDQAFGSPEEQQPARVESVAEGQSGRNSTSNDNRPQRQNAIDYLTPRILKSARLYFGSSGFYFSYDHDLSSDLSKAINSKGTIPLWKRYETTFFWNRHLMKPFADAGEDTFVLPLIQGFVGQRAFSIAQTDDDENDVVADISSNPQEIFEMQSMSADREARQTAKHDFLLTLISRRSTNRAGLRYLRRGVDDDGNVANNVETEQILSSSDWNDSEKTFSLVQLRGSIPLFFSQSPYSFKPLPLLFGSKSTNEAAFRKHFAQVIQRYGNVQATSLVDKHGTEVAIGEAYQKQAEHLNESGGVEGKKVDFEWFDFHGVCKGMRFDKISILLDTLRDRLKQFGWITTKDNQLKTQQKGILRTNCMDCLDRTNVVQSAVAGWALQQQLSELGLNIDLQSDPKTQWFNTLWADNGDAISKQYAGTSALKGDFTRTRKRNWTGALSDFSLTLNRYYNNIFGDYFLQTNIDYLLGNAGPAVFDEFEANMTSQDYALDMKHVRENAIDTCIKIVVEDPEETFVAGWTLSCPSQPNTTRALPFEECILLLTDAALYFCRFNWETEKIGSFERIDLLDIKELWRGAYITSALGDTHLDPSRNVGFALTYNARALMPVRSNTRSLSVADGLEDGVAEEAKGGKPEKSGGMDKAGTDRRMLAFKVLHPNAAAVKESAQDLASKSESDMTRHITDEIRKAMIGALARDHREETAPEVKEKDIISVADAKRNTGVLESLGYSFKKLVWS